MELLPTIGGLSWTTVLSVVVGVYTLMVGAFLVLENRSPQSTFAWLFLLTIFPIGGLIIYVMVGRSRHAFSRERSLVRGLEGTTLADRASRVLAQQPARLDALARQRDEYGRLARMLWATAQSPLTFGNRVEILQDASEKYPRLLADMRAAR